MTISINNNNRKIVSIERMMSVVYPLGFKCWYQPDKVEHCSIFHDNYSKLWEAYASLRASLPFFKRKGLDKAWHHYMAIEYYDEIPDTQPSKIFQKGVHRSREDAIERSSKFIKYLNMLC